MRANTATHGSQKQSRARVMNKDKNAKNEDFAILEGFDNVNEN